MSDERAGTKESATQPSAAAVLDRTKGTIYETVGVDEPYHYLAIYACRHRSELASNWNRVVENPTLGPYEGYCKRHGHMPQIIAFVRVPGDRNV